MIFVPVKRAETNCVIISATAVLCELFWVFFENISYCRNLKFCLCVCVYIYDTDIKKPKIFCQKCRFQVTAKHTCTLPTWLWMKWHCKLVHGWMVYTEFSPRRQQFHVAPAMQQLPKSAVKTPLLCIFKTRYKKNTVTRFESYAIWAQVQKRSI